MKTNHADYFGQIEDWRREHLKLPLLSDIVLLCASAVLCGADTFTQIEIFGQAHEGWYRKRRLQARDSVARHDPSGIVRP